MSPKEARKLLSLVLRDYHWAYAKVWWEMSYDGSQTIISVKSVKTSEAVYYQTVPGRCGKNTTAYLKRTMIFQQYLAPVHIKQGLHKLASGTIQEYSCGGGRLAH